MDVAAVGSDVGAVYRRVLRRETHVSRSAAVVVVMILVVLAAAAVVVAGVLVMLDQRLLGIDPRAVIDAAIAAPHGVVAPLAIAIGAVAAILGIVVLVLGVLPQRRPRHVMPSSRLAIVVDDEVIASATARAARTVMRLGPSATMGTVGRRSAVVVIRPPAGVDVPVMAVTEAVEDELAAIDPVPSVAARIRVQPSGRVD